MGSLSDPVSCSYLIYSLLLVIMVDFNITCLYAYLTPQFRVTRMKFCGISK